MKPRIILACFFAAYGVYLSVAALFSMAIAVSWFMQGMRNLGSLPITHPMSQYMQLFGLSLPMVFGLALVFLCRQLGALSAKFAGIADDATWDIHIEAGDLMTVLLVAVGIYIIASQAGAVIRLLFLLFEVKAGDHAISTGAAERLPDKTQIITNLGSAIAGALVAKYSRRIASALVGEK